MSIAEGHDLCGLIAFIRLAFSSKYIFLDAEAVRLHLAISQNEPALHHSHTFSKRLLLFDFLVDKDLDPWWCCWGAIEVEHAMDLFPS